MDEHQTTCGEKEKAMTRRERTEQLAFAGQRMPLSDTPF